MLNNDLSRWQAIGDHAKWYKSYLGTYVATVPHNYESWDQVPQPINDGLTDWLMRRFYLEPYLDHPESHPLREAVTRMIRQDALKIYRDKKSKFKKTWFTDRGGSQRRAELQGQPLYGMPP